MLASIPRVHGPILVEILYPSAAPQLDLDRLEARLARQFAGIGCVARSETIDGRAVITLEDLSPEGAPQDGSPRTVAFSPSSDLPDRAALADSVRQSWDWPLAKDAVAVASAAHVVMPMFSWLWLDRRTRLELIHAAVEAVLEQSAPCALHWPQSQCVVSPETYRRARIESDDSLYPAVNVRMFDVSGGRTDEIVMDTLGLGPLGLPDFQIRCAGLRSAEVARRLSNLALYIFEHGDVWRCSRAESWAEPVRGVIELDVAAGDHDQGVCREWNR